MTKSKNAGLATCYSRRGSAAMLLIGGAAFEVLALRENRGGTAGALQIPLVPVFGREFFISMIRRIHV